MTTIINVLIKFRSGKLLQMDLLKCEVADINKYLQTKKDLHALH